MPEQQIRYDDGASYERMMGVWSRLVGDIFIDWLVPCAHSGDHERSIRSIMNTETGDHEHALAII
jgi:hypothetical protein